MIYTLVGHSGYWVTQHGEFARAVEEKGLPDRPSIRKRILDAGGVIFTDYVRASDAAEAANYPDDDDDKPLGSFASAIIPRARGFWSREIRYDGLPMFIPDSDIRERLIADFGAESVNDPLLVSELNENA